MSVNKLFDLVFLKALYIAITKIEKIIITFFLKTLASIIYIYLATVTKAITFGGFLGDITDGLQAWLAKICWFWIATGTFCRVCWNLSWATCWLGGCFVYWLVSLLLCLAVPGRFLFLRRFWSNFAKHMEFTISLWWSGLDFDPPSSASSLMVQPL